MRRMISALWREHALTLALARSVGKRWLPWMRIIKAVPSVVFLQAVALALITLPALKMLDQLPESLFAGMAYIIFVMMFARFGILMSALGSNVQNAAALFYGAKDQYAYRNIIKQALLLSLMSLAEILVCLVMWNMHSDNMVDWGEVLFAGLILWPVLSLASLSLCLGFCGLSGFSWVAPAMTLFFFYLVICFFGVLLDFAPIALIFVPGDVLSKVLPQMLALRAATGVLSGQTLGMTLPWAAPALILAAALPWFVMNVGHRFRLDDAVEAWDPEPLDDQAEDSAESPGLELLDTFAAEQSGEPLPVGARLARCFGWSFTRRELALHQYMGMGGTGYRLRRAWSCILLIMLLLWRVTAAIKDWSFEPIWVCAVVFLTPLTWIAVGTRPMPRMTVYGGRQIPLEDGATIHPGEVSKLVFKCGILRMLVGWPIALLACLIAPFEHLIGDGSIFRYRMLTLWPLLMLSLPIISLGWGQANHCVSGRSWGRVLKFHLSLLNLSWIFSLGLFVILGWFLQVWALLTYGFAWAAACLSHVFFRWLKDRGYLELRLPIARN